MMAGAVRSGSEGLPSKVLRLTGSSVGAREWGGCLGHVSAHAVGGACPGIHVRAN